MNLHFLSSHNLVLFTKFSFLKQIFTLFSACFQQTKRKKAYLAGKSIKPKKLEERRRIIMLITPAVTEADSRPSRRLMSCRVFFPDALHEILMKNDERARSETFPRFPFKEPTNTFNELIAESVDLSREIRSEYIETGSALTADKLLLIGSKNYFYCLLFEASHSSAE